MGLFTEELGRFRESFILSIYPAIFAARWLCVVDLIFAKIQKLEYVAGKFVKQL